MPTDPTTAEKAERLGLQQCTSLNCGCNGTTWKDHANDRRYHVSEVDALYAERFPAPDYRAALEALVEPASDLDEQLTGLESTLQDGAFNALHDLRAALTHARKVLQ